MNLHIGDEGSFSFLHSLIDVQHNSFTTICFHIPSNLHLSFSKSRIWLKPLFSHHHMQLEFLRFQPFIRLILVQVLGNHIEIELVSTSKQIVLIQMLIKKLISCGPLGILLIHYSNH